MKDDQSVNRVLYCGELNTVVCTAKTKKELGELNSGETLKVLTMNPSIKGDFESLFKEVESQILEERKEGEVSIYIIRKGAEAELAELEEGQSFLNEIIERLQFSSGLDIAVVDMDGKVKASKLRYSKAHEIGGIIVEALEKTGKISETFSTGKIEEYVVHGENGYTLVRVEDPHILVVSGLKENQLGLAMQKLRKMKKN
ncbi:MAG: sulfurtransferase TusA family protein [Candidatus Freyarchaeum deiterrae]